MLVFVQGRGGVVQHTTPLYMQGTMQSSTAIFQFNVRREEGMWRMEGESVGGWSWYLYLPVPLSLSSFSPCFSFFLSAFLICLKPLIIVCECLSCHWDLMVMLQLCLHGQWDQHSIL